MAGTIRRNDAAMIVKNATIVTPTPRAQRLRCHGVANDRAAKITALTTSHPPKLRSGIPYQTPGCCHPRARCVRWHPACRW